MLLLRGAACIVGVVAWSLVARAEESDAAPLDAPINPAPRYWPGADRGAAPSQEPSSAAHGQHAVDRPFLYLIDPRLPAPLTFVAGYAADYTSTEAAARPLAANVNGSGFVNEFRLEIGVLERLSVFATGWLAPPLSQESRTHGAFDSGMRVLLTAPDARHFRVALDAAFLRDFADASGTLLRGTATYDVGRLRLGGMVHAEKAFARGRDDIDVYAVAGASFRAIDDLRVGVEYVGQDLEEIANSGAEGGARQFAGGSIAWTADRISVAAGPAFGLGGHAPSVLGRAQMAVAF